MNDRVLYMDSSAIAKVVLPEAETAALMAFLVAWPLRASSALAAVEVVGAVRRLTPEPGALRRAEAALQRLALVRLDAAILAMAAQLEPPLLGTLDAIHLASALSLGADLGGMVAYDRRLLQAARQMGVTVFSPGATVEE